MPSSGLLRCLGFFVATLAELIVIRRSLVAEIAANGGGITSVSVDGMSVNQDPTFQLKTIDEEIARLQGGSFNLLGATVKLVSPGCGR